MLKPKNAFGDVTEPADCAAGIVAAEVMTMMTSAATSVTARTRRARMDPPMEAPYTITTPGLKIRQRRRAAVFGPPRTYRGIGAPAGDGPDSGITPANVPALT